MRTRRGFQSEAKPRLVRIRGFGTERLLILINYYINGLKAINKEFQDFSPEKQEFQSLHILCSCALLEGVERAFRLNLIRTEWYCLYSVQGPDDCYMRDKNSGKSTF